MAQYKDFYTAWKAKNAPKPNVAESTWGTGRQDLANAYSAVNPTWQPDPSYGVKVNSVKFDPYSDVGYGAIGSAVENANTHATNERNYQYHQGAQSYGYDSEGRIINTAVNPDYNPYAEAGVLKKNYDNSVRGTTNSYAANGQLYSGAQINAQNTNDWNYGLSSDRLQRQANAFYHGQDQSVQNTADAGIAQLAAALGPAFSSFLAAQRGY